MSDPKRLRDLGDPSDPMRVMVRAAAKPRSMSADEKARTAAKVAAIAAAPIAAAVATKWASAKVLAILAAFAGLGAVITLAIVLSGPSRVVDRAAGSASVASSGPRTVAEPIAASASSSIAPVASASTPPVAVSIAPSIAIAPSTSASTIASSSLDAETALISLAGQKLGSDPNGTLAACAEHRAKFPNGALAMERDILEIRALTRLGRSSDVTSKGNAFLFHYPTSPHAAEVKMLVEESSEP